MAEIAVAVIDSGGKQWAQMLHDDIPIKNIIQILLDGLGLPTKLNYELIHKETDKVLLAKETLQKAGVQAGAELILNPVRDSKLLKLLNKLYKEAKKDVEEKMWEIAKEKLTELFRLDPEFEDSLNLQEAILDNLRLDLNITEQAESLKRVSQSSSCWKPLGCAVLGVGGVGLGLVFIIVVIVAAVLNLDIDNFTPPDFNRNGDNNGGDVLLGTGDVQITLRWSGTADLDLHVIDPFGDEIWYRNKFSQSGGELDVDANAGCSESMTSPVENVYWPTNGAPTGTYQVVVYYFSDCNSGPTDYEVTIKQDERVFDAVNGTLWEQDETNFVGEFFR